MKQFDEGSGIWRPISWQGCHYWQHGLVAKIGTKKKMAKNIQSRFWAGVKRDFSNNGWLKNCDFLQFFFLGRVFSNGPPNNKSSILLEQNGKALSSKRTRHINIRYFFISDRVNIKEIGPHWCSTKETVADFWTKHLQGSHFRKLRDYIMGRVRYVKPKCGAVSICKAAKRKVAKRSMVSRLHRSTVGGIDGHTRSLAQ
jgi:hypothetical protein